MTTKDKRLHIPVKDQQLQKRIKSVLITQGITYERLLELYLKLPNKGDLDALQHKFSSIRVPYLSYIGVNDKQSGHELVSYLWVILAKTALREFDCAKVTATIKQAIKEDTWANTKDDESLLGD